MTVECFVRRFFIKAARAYKARRTYFIRFGVAQFFHVPIGFLDLITNRAPQLEFYKGILA